MTTKEEIVKKAIEKTIKNGWHKKFITNVSKVTVECNDGKYWLCGDNGLTVKNIGEIEVILFDHSFCKAFWGTKKVCSDCGGSDLEGSDYVGISECTECDNSYILQEWELYIKQLALAEDRLEYIKQFI